MNFISVCFQVILLTDKLLHKEKERGNLELSNTDTRSETPPQAAVADSVSVSEVEVEVEVEVSKTPLMVCKQEDHSSTKSDVFDSDSPHYGDGANSALPELDDSSYVFEADQSDASQDEEDNFSKSLLHPSCIFPKLEDVGFPVEDQAFWSWSY